MSETIKPHPRSPGSFIEFAQEHAVDLKFVAPIVMSEYERALSTYFLELVEYYGIGPEGPNRLLGQTALEQADVQKQIIE